VSASNAFFDRPVVNSPYELPKRGLLVAQGISVLMLSPKRVHDARHFLRRRRHRGPALRGIRCRRAPAGARRVGDRKPPPATGQPAAPSGEGVEGEGTCPGVATAQMAGGAGVVTWSAVGAFDDFQVAEFRF